SKRSSFAKAAAASSPPWLGATGHQPDGWREKHLQLMTQYPTRFKERAPNAICRGPAARSTTGCRPDAPVHPTGASKVGGAPCPATFHVERIKQEAGPESFNCRRYAGIAARSF